MSIATLQNRIAELQAAFAPVAPAPSPPAGFSGALQSAVAAAPASLAAPAPVSALVAPPAATGGTPAGQAMVSAAQAEVGQGEQPPGSNDSLRIAQYRQATAGAGVGPWCAYFVSWAARQAGAPVGETGQGFGSVDALYDWAERAGKAIPAGPGVRPQPGDMIVWDEHIGLVEAVLPDGTIQTIEGNSSDQVARRTYAADGGGALGYVRLG